MDNCYFIFRDGKNFFARYLKKGFGHCCVIYQYLNLYILIENSGTKVEITPILEDLDVFFDKLRSVWDVKIVKIQKSDEKFYYKSIFNLFPSCVNFSKVVSCYHSRAQTPFALYQDLLKNGGIEIKEIK